ncbi:MAG: hypothetical protein OEL84_04190 [Nitrosopumilus sp.]|nr:hypothetical protein [Nitrosopumilus sp.]MDH3340471.1 hypothetical protein [Nitrosopumilus sp.]
MDKWADYLISKVSYDSEHLISVALRHQETEQGITKGKPIDRLTIASDIKNGLIYITIYSGKNSWKKGHQIQTFSIEGIPYLRIDRNKVKLDFLGDIQEFSTPKYESTKKLESHPEPITEPEILSSPRGSLPKDSAEELPQELDLAPEPITEQLSQLNDLQQKINELENILSTKPNNLSKDLPVNQTPKINKLENPVDAKIGQKIINILQKQKQKLDEIEKKLHKSTIEKTT